MIEFLDYVIFKTGEFSLTIRSLAIIIFLLFAVRIVLLIFKKLLLLFFKKRNVGNGRSGAIYLLTKYFFWTITIVAVMEMVGIHITSLIAGSAALLVGLGLGLQQIFQDLVSGIFILIESTIKINDVIEFDGMVGRILAVDLRTSSVLTRDGIMIIVPNHKFIVEKITNWTHNYESTRFKVEVGVAYESDVHNVKDILLACAKDHVNITNEKDESDHNPFVRFKDFGDSALKFALYFWTTDIFNVEYIKSDLRFVIDTQFRENEITMPFPQRDIHFKGIIPTS